MTARVLSSLLLLKTVILGVAACALLDPVVNPLSVLLIYMTAALAPVAAGLRAGMGAVGFDWSTVRLRRDPGAAFLFLGSCSCVVLIGMEPLLQAGPDAGGSWLHTTGAILLLAAMPVCGAVDGRYLIRHQSEIW